MKSVTSFKVGALLVGAVVLAGGRLNAAPTTSAPTEWSPYQHDQGTIQSIDPSYETFTILDNRQAVLGIEYNHHTRFYDENGAPITTRDLKPGERVSVTYRKEGDLMIPKTVRVLSEPNR